MLDEIARAIDDGMVGGPSELAETFEHPRGDVGGGRIEHRVVVGKRNVIQELEIVLVIEGAPAAVAILHADEPGKPAANRATQRSRIGIGDATERHQDERGVVHIRIEIVLKLECPAARRSPFDFSPANRRGPESDS